MRLFLLLHLFLCFLGETLAKVVSPLFKLLHSITDGSRRCVRRSTSFVREQSQSLFISGVSVLMLQGDGNLICFLK